eukprot:753270-Hanusia_phi.AAC.8
MEHLAPVSLSWLLASELVAAATGEAEDAAGGRDGQERLPHPLEPTDVSEFAMGGLTACPLHIRCV